MTRRWRGVLVTENVQTGDGRVIQSGALTWADLPLPLAWLRDGDQHINLTEVGPQVGLIETIQRVGDNIEATGIIDDGNPDGATLIGRMDAGTASFGHRQLVSIDPDDWAVELLLMDDDGEELLLASTGTGTLPQRAPRQLVPAGGVAAAAGDPDPGDSGVLLFADASDAIIERYTRMRIRGATGCAVSAFTSAWIELEAADAEGEPEPAAEPEPDGDATTASLPPAGFTITRQDVTVTVAAEPTLVRPPAEAFALPEPEPGATDDGSVYGMPVQELLVEQPDGGLAVPYTIVERDGVRWCFGHAARWGQCHVGYPGQCITAPESNTAYAHFHHGSVLCADGNAVATGPLTLGTDHAGADLLAPEARDHYAHTGLAFADVRATNGALGVWVSGALRPTITDLQLQVIRASSLSGDWRRIGTDLEFIGALAVNVPGFPISRELVAAAGLQQLPMAALAASAYSVDSVQMSLVAAGVVQRCPECQKRAMAGRQYADQRLAAEPKGMDEALQLLRKVELRTRHLGAAAAEHALAVIRR